jgi:TPR repeat protein
MNLAARPWLSAILLALLVFLPSAVSAVMTDEELKFKVSLHNASKGGDAESQYIIGFCYAAGRGVQRDWAEAVRWLLMSADQSNFKAQTALGSCFLNATGVPKDRIEAYAYYSLAAPFYPEARTNLDILDANFTADEKSRGLQRFQEMRQRLADREAFSAAKKAHAKSELSPSNEKMRAPARGTEITGESELAINQPAAIAPEKVKLFNELMAAAESGDTIAQFKVGQAYFDGDGVASDVLKGAKWYRKAAEKGNVDAQWNLANAYDYFKDKRLGDKLKIGVYDCSRQALAWWLMAAEQGHAPSQYKYANLLYNELKGTFVSRTTTVLFPEEERPKYLLLALKWSLKASEQGNVDAQYLLGMIYDDGFALGERRLEDAFVWYSLSAAGGKSWAVEKLDALELQLDSAAVSKAKARISSLKAEIESKKAGK